MTIAQQLEQKGIEKGIERGILVGEQRGLEKGLVKGRLEGRSEGERQAKLHIARTMLDNGLDVATVITMTGLTHDDLNALSH